MEVNERVGERGKEAKMDRVKKEKSEWKLSDSVEADTEPETNEGRRKDS